MGTYESIMAGTEVQEVRANLRSAQEDYERRVATIVGAEATGIGWDAPGFEEYKADIEEIRAIQVRIVDRAVERIAAKVQASIDRTA